MAGDDRPLIAGRIHGVRVWSIGVAGGVAELRGHREEPWAAGGEPTIARCIGGGDRRTDEASPPRPGRRLLVRSVCAPSPRKRELWPLRAVRVDRRAADAFPTAVAGIVEAWGRIELHADGFRAEFARPHTLALIGAGRESDVGELIERLALRYGARLVELEDAEDLVERCHEHGLGLAPATVRSLVPDDPPATALHGRAGSPRRRGLADRRARREARQPLRGLPSPCSGTRPIGLVGVVFAIGVIRAIVEPSPVEFRAQHLTIVDQALVKVGGRLRYVAVVRNTSDHRLALAAFPTGSVFDRAGNRILRLDRRERIETRPSLAPGATGLVVDALSLRPPAKLPERMAYEVEIRARRAPAADGATAPPSAGPGTP